MKALSSLNYNVTICKEALQRAVGEELVILQLDAGKYLSLDAVGRRMWELLQEHGHLPEVHAQLCAEYEAEPALIQRDLLKLIEDLLAQKLIQVEPL